MTANAAQAIDNVIVVYDDAKKDRAYLRACRTPDRKRVTGAWALFSNAHYLLSANKGWGPPETPSPAPFEIVPIESKGRGMVATRRIQRGELIIRERPIFMVPNGFWADPKYPYLPLDKVLLQLLYWLEQSDREKFLQLHNCKSSNECGPLVGILRTNSLGIIFYELEENFQYSGICLNISLVNHSCDPNATHRFNRGVVATDLYATRDIEKGEEITITYIDSSNPRFDRQEELRRKYCFSCKCTLCSTQTVPDPVGDTYRRLINKAADNVTEMWCKLVDTSPPDRLGLVRRNFLLMQLALDAMEKIGDHTRRINITQHLAFIYALLGDLEKFRKWGEESFKIVEASDHLTPCIGDRATLYANWQKWLRNPKELPYWAAWRDLRPSNK